MHKIIVFFIFFQLNVWAQSSTNKGDDFSFEQTVALDLEKSKSLSSKGYYPEAYDKVWNVLIAADSIKSSKLKYNAYKQLSFLYSIFYKKEKAISSLDSIFLYAKRSGDFKDLNVKSNLYYNAALTYRMNSRYEKANEYLVLSEQVLDSLQIPVKSRIYLITEKAHLYTLSGNYKKAENILTSIVSQITDKHQYASIVYSMLGDLYAEKKEDVKALFYYNKSLDIINIQNKRIGVKVDLLTKISKINNNLKNYELAYQQINESKVLGDSLFGSKSLRNNRLFEIKDAYLKSISANKQLQKAQKFELVEAQNDKFRLQLLFVVLILCITLTSAFFFVRLMRRKHQVEKKLASEKANAEIEIKKKELAVTALQLMEKEKLLEEIKKGLEEVKKAKNDISVEKIKSTINVNSTKTWEEFETRFVQINTLFYQSLGKKHPNLSRNELKLCALVKLNFSTKEMAQLLGISADGVNKARYRLRKKFDLQRDINLVSYIHSI